MGPDEIVHLYGSSYSIKNKARVLPSGEFIQLDKPGSYSRGYYEETFDTIREGLWGPVMVFLNPINKKMFIWWIHKIKDPIANRAFLKQNLEAL